MTVIAGLFFVFMCILCTEDGFGFSTTLEK